MKAGWRQRRGGRVTSGALLVVLATVCFLTTAAPAGAEITLTASLSSQVVGLGEDVTLTVTVGGSFRSIGEPVLPDLPQFQVYSGGTSSNFSWVNGSMSSERQYRYGLVPQKTGTFTIEPVELEHEGKTYRTEPLTLMVEDRAAAAGPSRRGGASPGAPSGSDPNDIVVGRPGDPMFLTARVDRETVYVNQQVIYTLRFYRSIEPVESPEYVPPSTTGFWVETLEPQRTGYERVAGRQYMYTEIRTALFPTTPGKLEIGSASLRCQVRIRDDSRSSNDPFDLLRRGTLGGLLGRLKMVTLTTDPIEVRVTPLPEEGRPKDFGGAVGHYDLRAQLDPREGPAGEPVTLRVVIEGDGNVKSIPDPSIPTLPGVRVYDGQSEVEVKQGGQGITGRKVLETVIVPGAAGELVVPPITLSYFDPVEGRFSRTRSDTLRFRAGPPRGPIADAGTGTQPQEVELRERDINHIRPDAGHWIPAGEDFPGDGLGLGLQGIPLLAMAIAWAVRREQRRRDIDPGGRRFRGAGRQAGRRLATAKVHLNEGRNAEASAELARALAGYVSDRLQLPGSTLTPPETREALLAHGAPEELGREVEEFLHRCDAVRFAPAAATGEAMSGLIESGRVLLQRMERQNLGRRGAGRRAGAAARGLLLAALVCAVWSATAQAGVTEDAEALFARGNEAYEAGDFGGAVILYRRALATGRESAVLHFNLGNALLKSGELGKAIASYRRSLRIDPRSADARENLELARARRADLPPPAGLAPLAALRTFGQRILSLRELVIAADVLYAGAALFGVLLILGRRRARPAFLVLGPTALAALILVAGEYGWRARAPEAVVVHSQVEARSGPGEEYTTQFVLHEGAEVVIEEERGAWNIIRWSGDLHGWVPADALERIDVPAEHATRVAGGGAHADA